ARPVDAAVLQVGRHQANARLARRRVVVRPAAVDQHVTEDDALAFEDLQHQVIRAIEAGARVALAAEAILVGDDHELVAGIAQLQQRRDHLRHEAQLLVGVDLEIRRLLDEGAVAVDEQDRRHAAALRADRAASTRSFSSGLPMLIRSASPSCGAARWSRTTTPAASSASNAACASVRASAAGCSACTASSAHGVGTGYGAWHRRSTAISSGAAIKVPIRAAASACALDNVRSTARLACAAS